MLNSVQLIKIVKTKTKTLYLIQRKERINNLQRSQLVIIQFLNRYSISHIYYIILLYIDYIKMFVFLVLYA